MKDKRRKGILFVPFALLLFAGCTGNFGKPKAPTVFNSSFFLYSEADFQKDYTAYQQAVIACSKLTAEQQCTSKALRDRILNRIKFEIDWNYQQFSADLFYGRASTSVALDTLELGLSTWATVAGALETKTVLAAILTGVKGTRLSIDKNFFREKTTDVLVAKMDLERGRVSDEIEKKMALSVLDYPLEEGITDLTGLYSAGTLQSGIQSLAADAGQATTEMRAKRALKTEQRLSKGR